MKDYHDLHSLCQAPLTSSHDIEQAIRTVFIHRGTKLKLPIAFEKESMSFLQSIWERYLVRQNHPPVPKHLSKTITTINDWLRDYTTLIID